MALTKDDKIRSRSPLKCCQSNDSLTSSDNLEEIMCETKNGFVIPPDCDKLEMCGNNLQMYSQQLKKHKIPRRPPANLCFDDISYSSWSWSMTRLKPEKKKILHGLSGTFNSGELSVIMGPSGAGKSTLLNILAGFTTNGSEGIVKINGEVRNKSLRFKKLMAYIPQDEEIRLSLTVQEAMTVAAHLKLGYGVISLEQKKQQITELLEMLGLNGCLNTITARLSGGQKKRLAIALELINNPPIIFLDEPTTGLDSLSCSQCVSVLKWLAKEGRTIICTLHQPSALIFEMFDHLYALADGRCIYQGAVTDLLPHLALLGLQCPPFHNPADFLIEVAVEDHNADIKMLADVASTKHKESGFKIDLEAKELLSRNSKDFMMIDKVEKTPRPASVIMQFLLLYKRNLITAKRNYMYLVIRLMAHVFIGFLFGYIYQNVGVGANTVLGNYCYLYGSLLLIVYTGKMSVTLSFPLEMRILTREHFNRWYKLTPYLLSVILIEIPFQVICAWMYIAISYWLTGQPFDNRIYLFVLFCTLCTLCAQAWGYFIGATLPIKIAVFLGPIIACLFSIFGFCIRYSDTPAYFQWLFHLSYYRAGFQGIVHTIYGINRQTLYCPEELDYCHYVEPTKFLKEMDMVDINVASNMSLIIVIGCIMHTLTYIALWLKLNKR